VQTTIRRPVSLAGIGLHSAAVARATLRPAAAHAGVVFRRLDTAAQDPLVPALWCRVEPAPLATRIANADGVAVSTIEHLMAALAATGLHNLAVDLDGPELPILDGSAAPWAAAILEAGLETLAAPLAAWQVLRPVEVADGPAWARLEPAPGPEMEFLIDFPDRAIGRQELSLTLAGDTALRELCDSRTFCRLADVESMRARGLARGGSLANALVVDGARVLTPGGARRPDEAVRHKMLDALGDLWTAGAPILGRYIGHRAGHALTNRLLRALFAAPGAVRRIRCSAATRARLPAAPGPGAPSRRLSAVA
jgi:UDP-3-O-[3-hydroxymyristoyl] N-acetylglucosamine deacetylase